ncbi:hypothetical protein [Nocardia neocaledoniensis]|uniref:hypothetical protein n=1 Tax=Nocardia neocaledoniensis TaxID=236511 RepID=UPI0024545DB6|nr:hypothetical protein [Nocardia neocaledoniensis]
MGSGPRGWPPRDRIVDVEYSHEVLIEHAGGVDGTLLVVLPRRTEHANPIQRPQEYNAIIDSQVLPFVRRYQEQIRNQPP